MQKAVLYSSLGLLGQYSAFYLNILCKWMHTVIKMKEYDFVLELE